MAKIPDKSLPHRDKKHLVIESHEQNLAGCENKRGWSNLREEIISPAPWSEISPEF